MLTQHECTGCGLSLYGTGECWRCQGARQYEAIMAMSHAEVEARLAELLHVPQSSGSHRTDHEAEREAEEIVAFRGCSTRAFADSETRQNWPRFFMKDASPATRDRVIAELQGDTGGEAGDPLLVLAFIGDERVAAQFYEWEQDPPAWRSSLHVAPEVYALQADWELSNTGTRRDLTFPSAVAYRPIEESSESSDTQPPGTGSVIGGMLEERCGRCSAPLVNAVTLDGADPRFQAFGITGTVSIPVCTSCVISADSTGEAVLDWVRYRDNGTSRIEQTGTPDFDYGAIELPVRWAPTEEWAAADEPGSLERIETSLWRSHAGTHEVPVVGGHPRWLQDADYARCPDCEQRMRQLVRIPVSCLTFDPEEGTWYAQICTDCRVATVLYQQT